MHGAALSTFTQSLLALAATAAVAFAFDARAADDARLRADLEAVGRRNFFFGHQSLGSSMIAELKKMAAEQGVPLRFADVSAAPGPRAGALAHAFLSDNGNPEGKLRAFATALAAPSGGAEAPASAVAMLKFCFVDFGPGTDVAALFGKYQATLADLRAKNPHVTFVHSTVPLTTVQGGFKALLKRLMGKTPYGLAENARREDFNELLRRAYTGREPIYDLARLESTAPDGKTVTVDWNGRAIPALYSGYTDDGGHLNPQGSRLASRRLVELLAALPEPGRSP